MEMGREKVLGVVMGILMVVGLGLGWGGRRMAAAAAGGVDCRTVTGLVSACSTFIVYGAPDPVPGSPCCDAVEGLASLAAGSVDNRRSVCRCLMGLIRGYSPNLAALPGFCGISLGFSIDPNTICDSVNGATRLMSRVQG